MSGRCRVDVMPMRGRCGVYNVRSIIINEGERLVTPLHQYSIKETRYFLKFSLLSGRVLFKPKKYKVTIITTFFNNVLEISIGSRKWRKRFLPRKPDFSQESEVSQTGQWTESSQEETEHFEPWSRFFDEAEKRHETQLNALINQYEENGDSENVARIKAENALLPVYRKELRKVLVGNLQWIHAMEKDPTFKKVMETQEERKNSEGYDWLESTELAIDKRKFLLNRLYEKQPIPQDQDWAYYECYRIFYYYYCYYFLDLCQLFRFNKNCKQPNFKCVLLMTSQSLQPFIYKGFYMKFII